MNDLNSYFVRSKNYIIKVKFFKLNKIWNNLILNCTSKKLKFFLNLGNFEITENTYDINKKKCFKFIYLKILTSYFF